MRRPGWMNWGVRVAWRKEERRKKEMRPPALGEGQAEQKICQSGENCWVRKYISSVVPCTSWRWRASTRERSLERKANLEEWRRGISVLRARVFQVPMENLVAGRKAPGERELG